MIARDLVQFAEDSAAGTLLIQPECIDRMPTALQESDFLSPYAGAVFGAVRDMRSKNLPVDPVTILEWAGKNKRPLTMEYAMQAMEVTPTCANADAYGRLVYEYSLRRGLEELCRRVLEDELTGMKDLSLSVKCCVDDIWQRMEAKALTRTAASYDYEEPRWLIAPYFQRGKGTMVQADPGVGKTAFMCAVAAAVSTGRGFLGLKVEAPGDVVILSNEDSPGQLRGRLEADGADLNRIHMMENPYDYSFSSPEIEQVIVASKAKMIIFDPFQAFLGAKIDLHRANETRPVLAKLFAMCEAHDCACVMIAHLGKNTTGKAFVNQSLGSVDIPGAMRSVIHILPHPEVDGQLMACHVKSSSAARGKTIAYSIGKRGAVNWLELTDDRIDELYAPRQPKRDSITFADNPMTSVLRSLIRERPKGGFWSYEALREQCVKITGDPIFQHAKSLQSLLTGSYLEELYRTEGIQLQLGAQSSNKRGIRLVNTRLPAPTPPPQQEPPRQEPPKRSEYDEMMALLNSWDRE